MDSITCVSSFRQLDSPDSSSLSDANNWRNEEEFSNVASSNPKRRAGRKKFRETRHPVYRGVRKRNNGKWVCEVREPNTRARIWLGTFPTPEMAARANDVAAMALRGRSACLNFADSAWRLPVPASADAKTIRKAAIEAAEAFRPSLQEDADSAREKVNQANLTCSSGDAVYVDDEEAVFGIGTPGLLANMAEGLLLSPPRSAGDEFHSDDVESDGDVSLWSYSI